MAQKKSSWWNRDCRNALVIYLVVTLVYFVFLIFYFLLMSPPDPRYTFFQAFFNFMYIAGAILFFPLYFLAMVLQAVNTNGAAGNVFQAASSLSTGFFIMGISQLFIGYFSLLVVAYGFVYLIAPRFFKHSAKTKKERLPR